MPRFVILSHDWPYPHFDFLLEEGMYLRGWRLDEFPRPNAAIPAASLPDHRMVYLEYEGPLSGERGSVQRIEQGTFDWIERTAEMVRVELHGVTINGPALWLPDRFIWQFN